MKIIRKIIVLTICSLMICFPASGNQKADTDEYPIKATDIFNRTITLKQIPKRIACLYAFSGHVVTMLGGGDRIVSVVPGMKRDLLLNRINPAIKKAHTPSAGGTINIEELIKSAPDIVFLKQESARIEGDVQKLDRFKIPYLVVGYNSMEEQMAAIEMIGKSIGLKASADAYNKYYRAIIRLVDSRVCNIPEAERVRVFHSVNEATRTDAPGTLEADWTRATGIINVSVGKSLRACNNKNFAGMEQILIWDPDAIIVNEEGVNHYILNNKKWSSLKAVKNKRVYKIPDGISRWGHPGSLETPLAVIWTAKTIYPELFTDISLEDTIKNYYSRFFKFKISDEMAKKILSGQGMRVSKNRKGK